MKTADMTHNICFSNTCSSTNSCPALVREGLCRPYCLFVAQTAVSQETDASCQNDCLMFREPKQLFLTKQMLSGMTHNRCSSHIIEADVSCQNSMFSETVVFENNGNR